MTSEVIEKNYVIASDVTENGAVEESSHVGVPIKDPMEIVLNANKESHVLLLYNRGNW